MAAVRVLRSKKLSSENFLTLSTSKPAKRKYVKYDTNDTNEGDVVENKKRRKNKLYKIKEHFEEKSEFDNHWKINKYSETYFHYSARACHEGEEDIFKCKYSKKVGYEKCENQIKVVFPRENESVKIFESEVEHNHKELENLSNSQKFNWKRFPDAEKIVLDATKHNVVASNIMEELEKAGISPLPTTGQLNNKIAYIRKNMEREVKKDITTSGELREALNSLIDIPDDPHKAFVNKYKIEILTCGTKARFWFNITTQTLLERYKNNPQKLFQVDGTYKLIWFFSTSAWNLQLRGALKTSTKYY